MARSLKIVALGRTQMLYEAIRRLHSDGHQIPLIVTAREAPEYTRNAEDFRELAQGLGAHFLLAENTHGDDLTAILQDLRPDIGISINWPNLIRRPTIDQFRHGIINLHPGDLPAYKGNACPNWALIRGEPRLTLCLHLMDPERLDAGPIVAKRHLPATVDTRIGEFYEFWLATAPLMFAEAVGALAATDCLTTVQQEGEGFRCFPRRPEDSEIDWRSDGLNIVRLINASSEPFSGATTWLGPQRLRLWRARFEATDNYVAVPGHVARRVRNQGEVAVTSGCGLVWLQSVSGDDGVRRNAAEMIGATHQRLGRPPLG